jgi:hypothetical protein
MPKHRARTLVAAVAVVTAVPVALVAGATSGPATAVAAAGPTGPTGPTGPPPPAVVTGGASQVHPTSAVLNGTINPEGEATTYYFQYGSSTAYGLQTSPADAGSASGNVAVHSTITGLSTGTTYHYRLVAQNASGTSDGADQTVTASQASQVRFIGHMGFVSPGRIIGVEAGCFGGDSRCYGHVTMSHNGIVIGQRDFEIAPNSGGFQNIEISRQGVQMMLSYNSVYHLLPVTVTVTTSTGQTTTQVMTLARWLWH